MCQTNRTSVTVYTLLSVWWTIQYELLHLLTKMCIECVHDDPDAGVRKYKVFRLSAPMQTTITLSRKWGLLCLTIRGVIHGTG